ncbi:MAG: thermonuclease family protein, partial [Pseudomonadota bacterium]
GLVERRDVRERDRWGRRIVVARSSAADFTLQDALVERGFARVVPETNESARLRRLLASEQMARAARRGLWRRKRFAVFRADRAEGAVGAFHIIEGAPVAFAERRSRAYLNFGADFRRDFTATLPTRALKRWREQGIDPAAWIGVPVRIRGFVQWINGPSIALKHSMQVETL